MRYKETEASARWALCHGLSCSCRDRLELEILGELFCILRINKGHIGF